MEISQMLYQIETALAAEFQGALVTRDSKKLDPSQRFLIEQNGVTNILKLSDDHVQVLANRGIVNIRDVMIDAGVIDALSAAVNKTVFWMTTGQIIVQ